LDPIEEMEQMMMIVMMMIVVMEMADAVPRLEGLSHQLVS
jgi:hypothetical protein